MGKLKWTYGLSAWTMNLKTSQYIPPPPKKFQEILKENPINLRSQRSYTEENIRWTDFKNVETNINSTH